MTTEPIRVMIVDDHAMVRRGLATILKVFDDSSEGAGRPLQWAGEAAGRGADGYGDARDGRGNRHTRHLREVSAGAGDRLDQFQGG